MSKKINKVLKKNFTFDKNKSTTEDLIIKASKSISLNGFCVIENIIPKKDIKAIREEIINSQSKSSKNIKKIKSLIDTKQLSEKKLLERGDIELRSVGRSGRPSKPVNDIIWMPKYSKYLANKTIVKLAVKMLDDQIRIAQLHPRIIPITSTEDETKIVIRNDLLGLPRIDKGPVSTRDWHTDWPHDPSAYGGENPDENVGFVRSPYPDVVMCLVLIWYLNDIDEKSGGTWVLPGSHKDQRNPRGPSDKIVLTAPIPGEFQIKAKAGSVFIQDSRLWHSAPMHNYGKNKRVAVVNRWCPWWLSINEFAPKSRFNNVCRPLSKSEYLNLPNNLKPLMKHLCPDELDTFQKPLLKKAKAAALRTRWAYQKLKKTPYGLRNINSKIKIKKKII